MYMYITWVAVYICRYKFLVSYGPYITYTGHGHETSMVCVFLLCFCPFVSCVCV